MTYRDTLAFLLWTGIAFLLLALLSDSPTDFVRPVYIVAKILTGSIPTIFVHNYNNHRGTFSVPASLLFLAFTAPISYAWSTLNLALIHALYFLWSLSTSSAPVSWRTLRQSRRYASISLGEILVGTLVCALEMWGAWAAAVALEREEARLLARAQFHYMNAQRTRRPMLTREQIEEKWANGDFGTLLTEG
ncbi:hypothetical protein P171DRAFT_434052 [Karstenula rhodostoma CBS 690.94]|uniref:Uncharacterized protein n=1 Tax=Karstenula rhodostoma CBS 690.94 TaxID=1392251 RepID=A0A9P4U8R0_9PLEO|nr:hypothetical protein P171DRAFT_434052 [Karstenula rhodostoma CBS 690.94]